MWLSSCYIRCSLLNPSLHAFQLHWQAAPSQVLEACTSHKAAPGMHAALPDRALLCAHAAQPCHHAPMIPDSCSEQELHQSLRCSSCMIEFAWCKEILHLFIDDSLQGALQTQVPKTVGADAGSLELVRAEAGLFCISGDNALHSGLSLCRGCTQYTHRACTQALASSHMALSATLCLRSTLHRHLPPRHVKPTRNSCSDMSSTPSMSSPPDICVQTCQAHQA